MTAPSGPLGPAVVLVANAKMNSLITSILPLNGQCVFDTEAYIMRLVRESTDIMFWESLLNLIIHPFVHSVLVWALCLLTKKEALQKTILIWLREKILCLTIILICLKYISLTKIFSFNLFFTLSTPIFVVTLGFSCARPSRECHFLPEKSGEWPSVHDNAHILNIAPH